MIVDLWASFRSGEVAFSSVDGKPYRSEPSKRVNSKGAALIKGNHQRKLGCIAETQPFDLARGLVGGDNPKSHDILTRLSLNLLRRRLALIPPAATSLTRPLLSRFSSPLSGPVLSAPFRLSCGVESLQHRAFDTNADPLRKTTALSMIRSIYRCSGGSPGLVNVVSSFFFKGLCIRTLRTTHSETRREPTNVTSKSTSYKVLVSTLVPTHTLKASLSFLRSPMRQVQRKIIEMHLAHSLERGSSSSDSNRGRSRFSDIRHSISTPGRFDFIRPPRVQLHRRTT